MNAPRLPLTLIPSSATQNARTQLSAEQWTEVRRQVYRRAGHRCEACQTPYPSGSPTGPGGWEAHEAWLFEGGVQKLVALRNLCQRCHAVCHSGRSFRLGGSRLAEPIVQHLMRVNGWDREAAVSYILAEFALVRARSRQLWRLDLSLLREFGIEPTPARTSSPLPSGRSWWQRFLGMA